MKILVVCMGNICRSPTAEAVFRHKVKERGLDMEIDSAGTLAYHQGETPDRRSRAAGERRGYDFRHIYARAVTEHDFEDFDLILAADKDNLTDLQRRCPTHLHGKLALMLSVLDNTEQHQEVPDPYYGGDKGFELVLDLIEAAAEAWLDKWSTQ
uniref:low molecular weight protein-tyrosine-phosphatase n=1 Tax=Thaumasiovibrio occultus TaxID=1891184 RepID=UPI000B35B64C|nr:low molecular weight protein-tyrosine-phosphatase [Thaumasiovibrio occultus]